MKTLLRFILAVALFIGLAYEPTREATATPPVDVDKQVVVEQKAEKPKTPKQSQPQQQVKPKPKAKPAPKTYSGTKYDWLKQAGIPQSQWEYADYIVSRESSWNPNAVNTSSGACSLAQALPCSKIPGDWRDPVNALRWQHQYVTSRYGGYQQAYEFWVNNHWY